MHWMSHRFRHDVISMCGGWVCMLFLVCGVCTSLVSAAQLETPTGRVILRVTGAISATNDAEAAVFDHDMLAALPQITIHTTTPWTEGKTTFEGPYARDVMTKVRATGTKVVATAINDYRVEIPLSDFSEFPVIFALARNGKRMSVRDKGPIWVIYPWSEQPQLKTEVYHSRSIWQLKALEIK